MSYRTPTSNVTSAILNIGSDDFRGKSFSQILDPSILLSKPGLVFSVLDDHLVSIDLKKREECCIVDLKYCCKIDDDLLRIILWYDNEWGYSSSIVRRLISLSLESSHA